MATIVTGWPKAPNLAHNTFGQREMDKIANAKVGSKKTTALLVNAM